MRSVVSFIAGLVFALGLGIAGMTRPEKVQSFLDIFGDWDPSLAYVMIGAIAVHALANLVIIRRKKPVLDHEFHLPINKKISPALISGSLLFGIGWGLAGLCPGPAIVSLVNFSWASLLFVICMLVGMTFFKITTK